MADSERRRRRLRQPTSEATPPAVDGTAPGDVPGAGVVPAAGVVPTPGELVRDAGGHSAETMPVYDPDPGGPAGAAAAATPAATVPAVPRGGAGPDAPPATASPPTVQPPAVALERPVGDEAPVGPRLRQRSGRRRIPGPAVDRAGSAGSESGEPAAGNRPDGGPADARPVGGATGSPAVVRRGGGRAPHAGNSQPGAAATEAGPLGDDRETERGLRGLVGSGSSQVSTRAALRARDAARPTDADLAAAEERLVIIRRNWVPREDLPRNR